MEHWLDQVQHLCPKAEDDAAIKNVVSEGSKSSSWTYEKLGMQVEAPLECRFKLRIAYLLIGIPAQSPATCSARRFRRRLRTLADGCLPDGFVFRHIFTSRFWDFL